MEVSYGLSRTGICDMLSQRVGFEMGLARVPLLNLLPGQKLKYNYNFFLYLDGSLVEQSGVMVLDTPQGL